MTVITYHIGQPIALFDLPGGKFINATSPLQPTQKPTDQKESRSERTIQSQGQ